MALNTELLLTLKNLPKCGNKTALTIAEKVTMRINTIDELCHIWCTLNGKEVDSYCTDNLLIANRQARQMMKDAEQNGVGIISYYEERFPEILRHTLNERGKYEAPVILFYRGNLEILNKPTVAIIGTRNPTLEGIKASTFFAEKIAKDGPNIVSGLAIGCDTLAHKGAIKAGGTTIAFLANGLDWNSIYPKENLELAKQIIKNDGLLLSEYPIGQKCNRYSLVARDRLQTGLAKATVVIQTGISGGTIHAVNTTLLAKKPLFMVKYKQSKDRFSEGNIKYIEEKKAMTLTSSNLANVLEAIGYSSKAVSL